MLTLPGQKGKAALKGGKTPGQKQMQNILFFCVGSVLNAVSVALFFEPFHISPGGIAGIAIVLSYYTPLSVGAGIILMNIPLVALAWVKLGRGLILSTAAATLLSSVTIDLLARVPSPANNAVVAALCAGIFLGVGLGLVFRGEATTGGTALIGKLMHHYKPNLKMGRTVMLIDGAIVGLNALVFQDFSLVIYALIALFLGARFMDAILNGV